MTGNYGSSFDPVRNDLESYWISDDAGTPGMQLLKTHSLISEEEPAKFMSGNQIKYKYFGRRYSTSNEGSLHPNYHYAKIQNYQNNTEINKMGLVIALNGISSSILKYKSIPISIFKQGQQAKDRRAAGDELTGREQKNEEAYTDPQGYLIDNFLSGWYVVKDYDIVWQRDGSFAQIVYLIRREWPMPYPGGNINQSE